MKQIYKIFMAVAAVAGVTACTTDVTEDLGVNLNEGQTTLTLSLDDTRTQLGDKADGVYPLTWAENDAISVNGSVSNALTANEAGATTATFTFNNGFGENPTSYFVAYPATSTNNQVVFAAEQTHTSNTTFGNNAAVMYGYTTDLSSVKLNHLTGVLKIGVVSGTTTPAFIKEVRISTVDRKPIAGAFNVDAEGKLTATEGATEVITYKAASDAGFPVPAGTATSENPAYIHVAVPAGVYGELYVTLESADGVMYKTVTTDSTKPVNAGTVREFSNNIEFVPTDEAEVFVISSYADLYEFKEDVEAAQIVIDNAEATEDAKAEATATLAKSVILVNDIQVPVEGDVLVGKDWEPINAPAYTGEFNGNGYAIKDLYAPLFGTTAIKAIKGLHLENIDITITNLPDAGALVCDMTNTEAMVSHCSVTGKFTVDVTTAPAVVNSYYFYGSLIGNSKSEGEISDIYVDVDFEVTENSVVFAKNLYVANCVGRGGVEGTDFKNITILGSMKHKGKNTSGTFYIASLATTGVGNVTNCVNGVPNSDGTEGSITVGSNENGEHVVGGLICFLNPFTKLTKCYNYGNITLSTGSNLVKYQIGGVTARGRGGMAENCANYGKILVNNGGTNANEVVIGGICAWDKSTESKETNTFKNCDNYGTLTSKASEGAQYGYFRMGGILANREQGSTGSVIEDCDNSGNITADSGKFTANTSIAGIVSFDTNTATSFKVNNCTNSGNILIEGDIFLGTNECMRVGGIFGQTINKLEDVVGGTIVNKGSITGRIKNVASNAPRDVCFGGIYGMAYRGADFRYNNLKLHNSGNVSFTWVSGEMPSKTGVGGIAGLIDVDSSAKATYIGNTSCNCTVTATGCEGKAGMIAGNDRGETQKATNSQVAGKLVVDGVETPITNENYFNYLYATEITKELADADGISIYTPTQGN